MPLPQTVEILIFWQMFSQNLDSGKNLDETLSCERTEKGNDAGLEEVALFLEAVQGPACLV